MHSLKKREIWLIAILLSSVVISGFIILSIQPLRVQLVSSVKEKNKLQKKFNKAKTNTVSQGSVNKMRKALESLKAEIETESKTMAGYQQNFIDLQKNEQQADLKAQITNLIEAQQMTILDVAEDSQSLDTLVNAQSKNSKKEISRPMINLKLTGNFNMLHDFIQKLEKLPNSVVVTRLSMNIERQPDSRAPYQLLIDLSLAL